MGTGNEKILNRCLDIHVNKAVSVKPCFKMEKKKSLVWMCMNKECIETKSKAVYHHWRYACAWWKFTPR